MTRWVSEYLGQLEYDFTVELSCHFDIQDEKGNQYYLQRAAALHAMLFCLEYEPD